MMAIMFVPIEEIYKVKGIAERLNEERQIIRRVKTMVEKKRRKILHCLPFMRCRVASEVTVGGEVEKKW